MECGQVLRLWVEDQDMAVQDSENWETATGFLGLILWPDPHHHLGVGEGGREGGRTGEREERREAGREGR